MVSKYEVFMAVVETGSFTKAAALLDYSQSAISQVIKTMERELGTALMVRRRDGVCLTADGQQYLPYIKAIANAQMALSKKADELTGLENSSIRIGTFTSVSRNILPQLMADFKARFPQVNFVLRQGEYTSISGWIEDGSVDFGFVNQDAVSGLTVRTLYKDKMMAVLPKQHPLAQQEQLSLAQLTQDPFIELDEGQENSLAMRAFAQAGLQPRLEYTVYDDYTILAMIRMGLGISMMYKGVLDGFEQGLAVRPLVEPLERTVALAWKDWEIMPYAARQFAMYILEQAKK